MGFHRLTIWGFLSTPLAEELIRDGSRLEALVGIIWTTLVVSSTRS